MTKIDSNDVCLFRYVAPIGSAAPDLQYEIIVFPLDTGYNTGCLLVSDDEWFDVLQDSLEKALTNHPWFLEKLHDKRDPYMPEGGYFEYGLPWAYLSNEQFIEKNE